MSKPAVRNEYQIQAEQFLKDTSTTLDIEFLYTGRYFPDDTKKRDIYEFTLKNARGEYKAKFGDSLDNTLYNEFVVNKRPLNYKEDWDFCKQHGIRIVFESVAAGSERKRPTDYDILACLDSYEPDTFDEFCNEFGYNDQPLSKHGEIMKMYLAVKEQSKGLRRIFTSDQLDMLAEIS